MCLRSSSRFHSPGKKRESPATCGRRDYTSISGNPTEMMTARINLRANVFNDNALAAIGRKQWHAKPSTESTAAGDWPKDRSSHIARRTPEVRQCGRSIRTH
jgi:hypothetical protein